MTVRKLNPETGDIATSGVQFIQPSREEIAQTILTRLRLFYGEYFRDITDGTEWFQRILGKQKTLQGRDAKIKVRIAQTPGVVSIVSYNADFDLASRTYSATCEVLTQYGVIAVSTGDVFNG